MAIYRGSGGSGDATNDASISAVTALTIRAEDARDAAASSATAAASSATAAANSESLVDADRVAAETAATAAETAQAAAEASETASGTSETNAATSASNAATSASQAATSASNASTSATAAASSATDAETAQTAAETAETNAASSASAASTSETNAASSASAASTSATAAATSATNASTSATAAATSATNASNSATASASSATSASNSATAAATSATNAASSATDAAASAVEAATAIILGNEPIRHSVRPSLLLDFANTKALDPRITFTRASTATYFDANGMLQTAASGAARFDHNPTTGESLGLLIEEQRTNLVLQSENISTTWANSNGTRTTDIIVSPDGLLNGDAFIENTVDGVHGIDQAITTSASTTYSFSVYAKEVDGAKRYLRLSMSSTASVSLWSAATYDLAIGSVTSTDAAGGGAVTSTAITAVGNGWYRCTLTGNIGANTDMRMLVTPSSSATIYTPNGRGRHSYTGDGYSGIYIWGAQLEVGAFPTSYIPTVASQVTRSADAASMTGANFSSWYRQDEGAVYLDYKTSGQKNSLRVASVSDGTGSNKMDFAIASAGGAGPYLFVVANGTNQVTTNAGTYTSNTNYKWAGAYKINNYAWSKDGGSVISDTDALVPVVNQLRIAQDGAGGNPFNGHIRKIAYYPKRLTNAELQGLTS